MTGDLNARPRQSRIPSALQAVFLASNRGKEVDAPPPENVAYKVFFRNWRLQRQGRSKENIRSAVGFFSMEKRSPKTSVRKAPLSSPMSPPTKPKSAVKVDEPSSPTQAPPPSIALSPQGYLDAMIRSRGYSTNRFKTLQTAYYNKPTALQQASHDVYMIELVRHGEKEKFRHLISSGISPNPCNSFGESLVHMVCRRGEADFLQMLLDAGCQLQVADDYGRTPLHDACWAAKPCFDVVELILSVDPRLFHMTDCRGAVPLSYVRKDHWGAWVEFLNSKKDVFWPTRDLRKLGEQDMPELCKFGPNTRAIMNPPNALTAELASMVAAGKMKPDEAQFLMYDKTDAETFDDSEDESESSEGDSDFSDDDDDEDEDDFSLDENEMAEILNTLTVRPSN